MDTELEYILLGLSFRTKSALLPLICGDCGIKATIHKRFLRFVSGIFKSNINILDICGKILLGGSTSTVGCNLNLICYMYNIDKYQLPKKTYYDITRLLRRIDDRDNSIEMGTRAKNILDILYMKECGNGDFNHHELDDLLNYLCEYDETLCI